MKKGLLATADFVKAADAKVWWAESGTRRAVAISSILALILAVVLLWSDIKDFLYVHPWWQSFVAALPGIALVVLAYRELLHSGEANTLRHKANNLREEGNALREQSNALKAEIASLTEKLDTERNRHLQQIAANATKQAEAVEAHTAELVRQFDEQTRENSPITKAFRAVQEKEARIKMGLEPESAEYHRRNWLDVLRKEYISGHDNISHAIMAGTELPPAEWLNPRIVELNEALKNLGNPLRLPLVEDNPK